MGLVRERVHGVMSTVAVLAVRHVDNASGKGLGSNRLLRPKRHVYMQAGRRHLTEQRDGRSAWRLRK